MALVRTPGIRCLAPPIALALVLAGCNISSLYIDLDAHYEDGELWFEDPNQSWFMSHCVRVVEVTRVELHETLSTEDRTVWEATGQGSECLTGVPFRYGDLQGTPNPDRRYTAAKPLAPGETYEIFVELSNGAGSGEFTLDQDGAVTNLD